MKGQELEGKQKIADAFLRNNYDIFVNYLYLSRLHIYIARFSILAPRNKIRSLLFEGKIDPILFRCCTTSTTYKLSYSLRLVIVTFTKQLRCCVLVMHLLRTCLHIL